MERDFLGLLTVKEENVDVTVDSVHDSALGLLISTPEQPGNNKMQARVREPGMQWSFSNNISGPSQYLFFRTSQEARPWKNIDDQLDSNQTFGVNGNQKVMVIDKSARIHYPVSAYPLHHFSTHSIGESREMRMFASANQPNQAVTVTMSPPVVHSHISPVTMDPQPFRGVPVLHPVSVPPSTCSVVGSTDLRNGSKQNQRGRAQLTIFYAGSVNVFDDISPEKAQAIMLLAGNVAPVAHHKTAPATEVSGPFKKPVIDEGSSGNRTQSPAFLSLPGAISVSSQAVSSSQGKPICNLELATVKSLGSLEPSVITQQEPPKVVHSLGSPSASLFSAVALPQARKASLTRFLEKRKERVSSTSPYLVSKKSPESGISKVSND